MVKKPNRYTVIAYVLMALLLLGIAAGSAAAANGTNSAPAPIDLGTAGNFAILSKAGISTTGDTSIVGDIGVSPIESTAITGFGLIADASNEFSTSSLVTGKVYAANYAPPTPSIMTTAVSDMETAFTAGNAPTPDVTGLGAGNIGGMTLAPGVYKWDSGVTIPANVTLTGNSTDVWIFQIAESLSISPGQQIILSGGADAKNIFWVVSGQTTLGTTSVMNGNILDQTAIVMETGATLNGRALAQTAVTLDANAVTLPAANGTNLTNLSGLTQSVNVSTNATYTFSLQNNGSMTDNYTISVSNPNSSSYGLNITSPVMLMPNETQIFTLNVSSASAGTFPVNITVNSTNDPTKLGYVNTTTITYAGSAPAPEIDIEKSTNGEDADNKTGPYIRLNNEVVWDFNVTNTGNVNLTDIEVTDDELGLIGTIPLLQPGESCVLTESGTASLGQYESTATAVGVPPIGPNVTDSDMSHYFGHDSQPNFEVPTANPLLIIGMLGLAGVMGLRRKEK